MKDKQFSWLRRFVEKGNQKEISFRYLFFIFAVGIVLMLLGNFFDTQKSSGIAGESVPVSLSKNKQKSAMPKAERLKGGAPPSSMIEYAEYYESELKKILEDIYGVDNVSVFVTVGESEQIILGKNESVQSHSTNEEDQQGGTREIDEHSRQEEIVLTGNENRPIIIGRRGPEIIGVAVVAEGVDNAQVKAWVKETVSRALHVPPHRIAVTPRKTGGDES